VGDGGGVVGGRVAIGGGGLLGEQRAIVGLFRRTGFKALTLHHAGRRKVARSAAGWGGRCVLRRGGANHQGEEARDAERLFHPVLSCFAAVANASLGGGGGLLPLH